MDNYGPICGERLALSTGDGRHLASVVTGVGARRTHLSSATLVIHEASGARLERQTANTRKATKPHTSAAGSLVQDVLA